MEIDDYSSLKSELDSLFNRISSESETYRLVLSQIKDQLEGLSKYFELTMEDEKVSKNYKH